AATEARASTEIVRDIRRTLRLSLTAGEGRHEAHAEFGAALGRPVGYRRQHAHGHVRLPARFQGEGSRWRADRAVRSCVQRAMAPAAGAWRSSIRSPHSL